MRFLKEAKQVGTLYHITNIEGMDIVLNQDVLKGKTQFGVSFTRNKNLKSIIGQPPRSIFKLIIDGDKLSNNYKIYPRDTTNRDSWVPDGYERVILHEYEEYVDRPINNISKYITGVIIMVDSLIRDKEYLDWELTDDSKFWLGRGKVYYGKDLKSIINKIKSVYPLYIQHNNIINQDYSLLADLNLLENKIRKGDMKFLKESYPPYKYEELYYDEVEFDRYSGPIDYWTGDQRCDTINIPHTYNAPVEEVREFLADFVPEDISWEHIDEYLDEHYDDLLETHMKEVLEHFLEDAIDDAAENYDEGDWYDGPDRDEDY